jgi:hypothetical protein
VEREKMRNSNFSSLENGSMRRKITSIHTRDVYGVELDDRV